VTTNIHVWVVAPSVGRPRQRRNGRSESASRSTASGNPQRARKIETSMDRGITAITRGRISGTSRRMRGTQDLGVAIDHHRPTLCLGDHLGSSDTFLPRELARSTIRPDCDGDDRSQ
jgi:hypothetical protein